jgi:signal transduction histidine kinase
VEERRNKSGEVSSQLLDHFEFLRSIPFFKNISDDELRTIARFCREEEFSPGQVLFRENDEADCLYVVLEGEVEVWKAFGSSDAEAIAVNGRGNIVGEVALIDDLPRSATVVSRGTSRALRIDEQDFHQLLEESHEIALSMLRSLSAMVRQSNDSFLADLIAKNRQLEEAYRELQETQQELVRQERLSILGKFSSMILHDIRKPMATILANADLLAMNKGLDEKAVECVDRIRRGIDELGSLTREVLDFSRGTIRLEQKTVDMDSFMGKVEEVVRQHFPTGAVNTTVATSYHGQARFDVARMLRVLFNLSDNARKAMGSSGKFSIEVKREGNGLVFIVRDTGEGMSEEILANIYEPFFSSSKGGGSGLGLVIVKNIVEAHGGSLKVESSPGKGTVITISIPLGI